MTAPADKPLFIPLKREFFEAFANGSKETEYRPWGPRWNAATCFVGRPVVLSLGYGRAHRLQGKVIEFTRDADPDALPGWTDCFRPGAHAFAACIRIQVRR